MHDYLNYTVSREPFSNQKLTDLHWECFQAIKDGKLEEFFRSSEDDTVKQMCLIKALIQLDSLGFISPAGKLFTYTKWAKKNLPPDQQPGPEVKSLKPPSEKKVDAAAVLPPKPITKPNDVEVVENDAKSLKNQESIAISSQSATQAKPAAETKKPEELSKSEPKVQSKVEPKPEPALEPKPVPKAKPNPEPKDEPKVETESETKPKLTPIPAPMGSKPEQVKASPEKPDPVKSSPKLTQAPLSEQEIDESSESIDVKEVQRAGNRERISVEF